MPLQSAVAPENAAERLDPLPDRGRRCDDDATWAWTTASGPWGAWGRRRLAYEVDKHNEGVYTLVRYHGTNEILNELERRFRINENLLRHLTVVAEGPLPSPEAEGERGAESAGEAGDDDDSADQAD